MALADENFSFVQNQAAMTGFATRLEVCTDTDGVDAVMEEAQNSRINQTSFEDLRKLAIIQYRTFKKKSSIPVPLKVENFM